MNRLPAGPRIARPSKIAWIVVGCGLGLLSSGFSSARSVQAAEWTGFGGQADSADAAVFVPAPWRFVGGCLRETGLPLMWLWGPRYHEPRAGSKVSQDAETAGPETQTEASAEKSGDETSVDHPPATGPPSDEQPKQDPADVHSKHSTGQPAVELIDPLGPHHSRYRAIRAIRLVVLVVSVMLSMFSALVLIRINRLSHGKYAGRLWWIGLILIPGWLLAGSTLAWNNELWANWFDGKLL